MQQRRFQELVLYNTTLYNTSSAFPVELLAGHTQKGLVPNISKDTELCKLMNLRVEPDVHEDLIKQTVYKR